MAWAKPALASHDGMRYKGHMRSIALLPLAALAALLGGCSTEDAGSTLTVDLSGVGMVMSRETIGTATTPDQYEGSTTATARVVYRGRNELVYR